MKKITRRYMKKLRATNKRARRQYLSVIRRAGGGRQNIVHIKGESPIPPHLFRVEL